MRFEPEEPGPSELELLLCNSSPMGSIELLAPRTADSWSLEFPDLRSLPRGGGQFTPLRICIATEDIAGPVRNGGIGTTYAALAELLAAEHHDVTILYLRGLDIETGDIDQWVRHYAEKGVKFVPVPNYAGRDRIRAGADRWLRAPYNMLRYLSDHPMDVVHASEWRGSPYLSLLAKGQGIAFADTLFVVKTSSPWMWSRLYGSQPLDRLEDLAKIHAERQSVELADMVIGGSLHLLRWMSSQGYRIPRSRTFVQPNVATFDKLADLVSRRPSAAGSRIPIDEFVFFGRLEARKGLFLFCQAVKRLIRQGVELPPTITFVGKPGERLAARPGQTVLEYIEAETRDWPTTIQILTDLEQHAAIQYLLEGPRLAVMPSMIENSSMAIYEAAICHIPCVATAVGGNAELVARSDRRHILCEAHPLALGDKLREALDLGGYVPRPSFDNDQNLEVWKEFHRSLACGLREALLADLRSPTKPVISLSTSVCIYFTGAAGALHDTLDSLLAQEVSAREVLIAVDADDGGATKLAVEAAAAKRLDVRVVETFDLDAGAAFNALAELASGDHLLFLWEGATLRPSALRVLANVADSSQAELLNYFHRVVEAGSVTPPSLKTGVIGSPTDAFFRRDITALPLFVRRQTFIELDGFSTDYRVLCFDYELVAKARLAGRRCETVLLELGDVPAWDDAWLSKKGYDIPASYFRSIRPQLAAAPLGLRDMLLLSKGLQIKSGGAGKSAKPARGQGGVDRPAARVKGKVTSGVSPAVGVHGAVPSWEPSGGRRLRGANGTGLGIEENSRLAPVIEAQRQAVSRLGGNVVQQGALMGQFLSSYEGVAYGWVVDMDNPARRVELFLKTEDVNADGRKIPATANFNVPFALSAPEGLEGHGFRIPIRSVWADILPGQKLWASVFGSKPALNLTLATADGLVISDDLVAPPPTATLASCGVSGFCDASDDAVVRGWIWRGAFPEERLDVAIFVDRRFLVRTTAGIYREDVHSGGYGDGEYGFSVPIPKEYRDDLLHRIDIVVADSGVSLMRSPLRLRGRHITFADK